MLPRMLKDLLWILSNNYFRRIERYGLPLLNVNDLGLVTHAGRLADPSG